MFKVDPDTKTITLHRGDTGPARFRLTGYTFDARTRVLWTMKDKSGSIIKEGLYTPDENGRFTVHFKNEDTDYLSPGEYDYDARVAIDPIYDDDGKIINVNYDEGGQVTTPRDPMKVIIKTTVGQI